MLPLAAAFFVVLYIVFMGGSAALVAYGRRLPAPPPPAAWPPVAVVVAARNEETRLPGCLAALRAQTYPADRLTVYVANDHSTDDTAGVIAAFQQQPGVRIEAVAVPDPVGHLKGKANALHAAIGASTEPLILITDADCLPPPDWTTHMAACLASDDRLGLVAGPTGIQHRTLGETVQHLDWVLLLAPAAALSHLGLASTAMGNNMGIRRAAYEAIGGYPALPFSIVEDYELMRAIDALPGYRSRFPLGYALQNVTLPVASLWQAFQQRRRWARGGLHVKPWVYGMYVTVYMAHLLPLLSLAVAPLAASLLLLLKMGADAALLLAGLPRGQRPLLLRAFLPFEGYLYFYVLGLPIAVFLFPTIEWKDRTMK